MIYSFILEDCECAQHQPLQDLEDSAGPSKEPPVDSTSPDTRYAEGEGVQEMQDEPSEVVVCPSKFLEHVPCKINTCFFFLGPHHTRLHHNSKLFSVFNI